MMNIARRIRPAHVVWTLVISLAALIVPALATTDRAFALTFVEHGLVEQLSLVLWLILAAVALLLLRPVHSIGLPVAVLSIVSAAREADLHKRFTGYSVLKPGYFLNPDFSTSGKLLTALILAAALFSLVALVHTWRRRRGRFTAAGRCAMNIVLIGLVTLAVSKLIDRTPSLLQEWFGIAVPASLFRILMAWEEGLELLVPLVLASAVIVAASPSQPTTEPSRSSAPDLPVGERRETAVQPREGTPEEIPVQRSPVE